MRKRKRVSKKSRRLFAIGLQFHWFLVVAFAVASFSILRGTKGLLGGQIFQPSNISAMTSVNHPTPPVHAAHKKSPTKHAAIAVEPSRLQNYLRTVARRHGINEKRFLAVAGCESSLNPDAVGDSGQSHGMWQIHWPSHPDVTYDQAHDPGWSTEWAAKHFKKDPTIWTCYRKHFATGGQRNRGRG